MKISELLAVVDEGWIRKPKGFRVRFQTRVDGQWLTDTMPGERESALDSDVVTWRSAWKLWQAARSGTGEYVNITVVDDRNEPVRYYANGRFEVFNPMPEVADASHISSKPAGGGRNGETFVDAQPGSDEIEAEGPAAGESNDK